MAGLSDEILERLAELVHRHLGLHFPRERWPDLVRGIEATCTDLGNSGIEVCARKLLSPPMVRAHLQALGRHLTIGETYFFREPQAFNLLTSRFLPELLVRRRLLGKTLRLWSVACASGEEAYSLAIMLRSQIPDLPQWQVTLLATDINTASLRKAEKGEYGHWSFRAPQESFREQWFTRTEAGLWRVRPEIRELVTFAFHNLVEDPYPSLATNTNAMDLIFCRNVLMYFAEPMRRRVLEGLQRSLIDGGWLVLGAAETSIRPPAMEPVVFPDLVVYRKPGATPSAPLSAPPRPSTLHREPLQRSRRTIRAPAPAPSTPFLDRLQQAFGRGEFGFICRQGAELPRHDPDFAAAALLVARACANAGRLPEALVWVEEAIPRYRLNPEGHYLRAMILDEQGRTEEALDALRTTLYLAPDFLPAHVALGNIARRTGDRRQAERNFRNALQLLASFGDDDPVPHAEEMRAGRLREAVLAALGGNGAS